MTARAMAAAEVAGERRAARAVARIAAAVRLAVPDARVEQAGDDLVVTGRGVRDALRWPAGLLR